MKYINPNTCTHTNTQTQENVKLVRQPQRKMTTNLREIIKELQKLLNVKSIYLIHVASGFHLYFAKDTWKVDSLY